MKKGIKHVAEDTEKLFKKICYILSSRSPLAAFSVSLAVGSLMHPKVVCSFWINMKIRKNPGVAFSVVIGVKLSNGV